MAKTPMTCKERLKLIADFCWPNGTWRGELNMLGLLNVLCPLGEPHLTDLVREEKVEATLLVANTPDRNGNVYSPEALEQIAHALNTGKLSAVYNPEHPDKPASLVLVWEE